MRRVSRRDLEAAEKARETVLRSFAERHFGAGVYSFGSIDAARALGNDDEPDEATRGYGRVILAQLVTLGYVSVEQGGILQFEHRLTAKGAEQVRRWDRSWHEALREDWAPELRSGLVSLVTAIVTALAVYAALGK